MDHVLQKDDVETVYQSLGNDPLGSALFESCAGDGGGDTPSSEQVGMSVGTIEEKKHKNKKPRNFLS